MAVAAASLLALSAGAQIFSGMAALRSADAEAGVQRQQAELASMEANEEAARTERDAESFRKRQKILFLKSGVALEGSPLLILEETQRNAQKEADAIRKQGVARFSLGQQRAKQAPRKGRAALLGSVGEAFSSIASVEDIFET